LLIDYKDFKFFDFQITNYNYDEEQKQLVIDCLYRRCEKGKVIFKDVKEYERNNLIGGTIYYIEHSQDRQQCDYEIIFRDSVITIKIWADAISYIL